MPHDAASPSPTADTLPGDLVWSLGAAAVATMLGGYVFGEGNQLHHLVQLERALDPGYLAGDFFVEATAEFSPRRYYTLLVSALSPWIALPILFALLTWCGNAAVGLSAARLARRLDPGTTLGAPLATALVLGLHAFGTGGATHLPRHFVEPSLLARGLALPAVVALLAGRPLLAALGFAGAIALHPLIGAETATLALAALAIGYVARRPSRGHAAGAAVVALSVASAAILLWGSHSEPPVDTATFVTVLAHIRAPHHYLPGSWPAASHAAMAVFLAAAMAAWASWRRRCRPGEDASAQLLSLLLLTTLFCLTAWPLVQWWPTRLGVTAQSYRMAYVLKWVGLTLFAVMAARDLRAGRRLPAALALMGWGRAYGLFALAGQILREREMPRIPERAGVLVVAGVAIAALLPATNRVVGEPIVTWSLLGMLLLSAGNRASAWLRYRAGALAMTLAAVVTIAHLDRAPAVLSALGYRAADLTWEDRGLPLRVERWAREQTRPDTVFVVPPGLDSFRYMARRAVVVDFKAFPFGDQALLEWYRRVQDCCEADARSSEWTMSHAYAAIDDERLGELARSYGAGFAVLYPETPSRLPVVYADESWRVVELPR